MAFHRRKMAVLATTAADVFAFETIPCISDGVALATLLASEFPSKKAWMSFSGSTRPGEDGVIASGESLHDAVAAVEAIAHAQVSWMLFQ